MIRVADATIGDIQWLSRGTKLLPIGSCFAVNFARWIELHDVVVQRPKWGMHYNSATIRAELEGAAEQRDRPALTFHTTSEEGGPSFVDALRHPITAVSPEELKATRLAIGERAALAFRTADAFLLTLGLGEVWEAKASDGCWTVLNRSPPVGDQSGLTLRTRFLTVDEVCRDVLAIVDLIRSRHGAHVPIVFTVSPIPLKETFSGLPLETANLVSKSVVICGLHTALRDRRSDSALLYFPAYELFWSTSAQGGLWQRDGRHPTAEAIVRACRRFVELYAVDQDAFAHDVAFSVKQV